MPLRLVNKNRTCVIQVCDTKFHIISMTFKEREELQEKIKGVATKGDIPAIIDLLEPVIVRIEGHDDMCAVDVLRNLEDMSDLYKIFQSVVNHCRLTEDERKNFSSLSAQVIPESAGNAEKNAGVEKEPASNIQTKTDI